MSTVLSPIRDDHSDVALLPEAPAAPEVVDGHREARALPTLCNAPFIDVIEWTRDELGDRFRPIQKGNPNDEAYLRSFIERIVAAHVQNGWALGGRTDDTIQTHWVRRRIGPLKVGRSAFLAAITFEVRPAGATSASSKGTRALAIAPSPPPDSMQEQAVRFAMEHIARRAAPAARSHVSETYRSDTNKTREAYQWLVAARGWRDPSTRAAMRDYLQAIRQDAYPA